MLFTGLQALFLHNSHYIFGEGMPRYMCTSPSLRERLSFTPRASIQALVVKVPHGPLPTPPPLSLFQSHAGDGQRHVVGAIRVYASWSTPYCPWCAICTISDFSSVAVQVLIRSFPPSYAKSPRIRMDCPLTRIL